MSMRVRADATEVHRIREYRVPVIDTPRELDFSLSSSSYASQSNWISPCHQVATPVNQTKNTGTYAARFYGVLSQRDKVCPITIIPLQPIARLQTLKALQSPLLATLPSILKPWQLLSGARGEVVCCCQCTLSRGMSFSRRVGGYTRECVAKIKCIFFSSIELAYAVSRRTCPWHG
jgi:hypothetical protein